MNLEINSEQDSWLENSLKYLNFGRIAKQEKLRIESSQRSFYRITSKDYNSIILMVVPHGIDESVRSFVDKAEIFKKYSVNVPNVYSYDLKLGLILVEDFGDNIYQYNLQEDPDYFYEKAINELVNIQSIKKDVKNFNRLDQKLFSDNWILFEDFFYKSFLELSDYNILSSIKDKYEFVCSELLDQPQVICHYDFECRNLILTPSGKAGVLDFQDALNGPIGLDLASLFKDLYYEWPQERVSKWYKIYLNKIKENLGIELKYETLVRYIDFASIQRQVRILGKLSQVFAELDRKERLKDFPTLLGFLINTSAKYDELRSLSNVMTDLKNPLQNKMESVLI